jgi:hypothetical protein
MESRFVSRLDSAHPSYPAWVPPGTLVERQVHVLADFSYGPTLLRLLDNLTTTFDQGLSSLLLFY